MTAPNLTVLLVSGEDLLAGWAQRGDHCLDLFRVYNERFILGTAQLQYGAVAVHGSDMNDDI